MTTLNNNIKSPVSHDTDVDLSFDLSFEDERPSATSPRGTANSGKPTGKPDGIVVTGPTSTLGASGASAAVDADDHPRTRGAVAPLATPLHTAESRLSPIVSAETEALMKRLRSASGSVIVAAPPGVVATGSQPPLLGIGSAASLASAVHPYPNSYGTSPSFAELGLTKTAESLAASEGVAAEDANGLIVYGEPGTPLNATSLLEAIASLKLAGEALRHWHRDGQHFCFVEFTRDVDTADVAKRIAAMTVNGVALTAELCRRITPGRDPRTHRATSEFKSSTLVLKNLPFQLRQETLTEILNRMPCAPASINYHYDTTGAFRGMAFVKYATIDDAYKVFNELNGLDIMGRALRVEYKRHSSTADAPPMNTSGGASSGSHSGGLAAQLKNAGHVPPNGRRGSASGASVAAPAAPMVLDPNELSADARGFYEQLLMFKQNTRLNELAFPPSLTVHQRKQLHFLAEQIGGLAHCAVGEGGSRFLVVSKHASPQMSSVLGAAPTSVGLLQSNSAAHYHAQQHAQLQQHQQQQQQHRRNHHGGHNNNNHNNNNHNNHSGINGAASYSNSSYLSRSPNQGSSAAAFGARSWNERERKPSGSNGGWGGNGSGNTRNRSHSNKGPQQHVHHAHSPPAGSPPDSSDGASAAAAAALANDPSLLDDNLAPRRPRSGTGGADSANTVVRQPRGPTTDAKGFGDNKGFTVVTRR